MTAWKIAIYLDLEKSYSWVPNTIMLEVRRRFLAHPAYIEERRRQFEICARPTCMLLLRRLKTLIAGGRLSPRRRA